MAKTEQISKEDIKSLVDIAKAQQEIIAGLQEQVQSLVAEKTFKSAKATVKIEGTDNPTIVGYLQGVYSKRKYNPVVKDESGNPAGFKIVSISVKEVVTTPKGHLRLNIAKTLHNGDIKEHSFMIWLKPKAKK